MIREKVVEGYSQVIMTQVVVVATGMTSHCAVLFVVVVATTVRPKVDVILDTLHEC